MEIQKGEGRRVQKQIMGFFGGNVPGCHVPEASHQHKQQIVAAPKKLQPH